MLKYITELAAEQKINLYRAVEYYDGAFSSVQLQPANCCNDSYSVSKSFTATAAGILIDRGLLSETESVLDVLGDLVPEETAATWARVTVADVMRQTVGISSGFLDIDVEDTRTYGTEDFLSLVLNAPMPHAPGGGMVYSDSNYYLLSRIVTARAGQELCAFLQENLFSPLQFQGHAWARCPMGYSMGATGFFLSADDMAKFGLLYLQNGVWNGKRILSEEWIKKATAPQSYRGEEAYGFGFWPKSEDVFCCSGMYGQRIAVFKKENRVIAWQAYDTERKTSGLLKAIMNKQ